MAAPPPRKPKENTLNDLDFIPDHLVAALARLADAVDTIALSRENGIDPPLGGMVMGDLVALNVACDHLARYVKDVSGAARSELLGRPGARPGFALRLPDIGRVSVTQGDLMKRHDIRHFLTVVACAAYPTLDGSPCDATELPVQARAIIDRVERALSTGTTLKVGALQEQGLDPAEFITVTGRSDPKLTITEA